MDQRVAILIAQKGGKIGGAESRAQGLAQRSTALRDPGPRPATVFGEPAMIEPGLAHNPSPYARRLAQLPLRDEPRCDTDGGAACAQSRAPDRPPKQLGGTGKPAVADQGSHTRTVVEEVTGEHLVGALPVQHHLDAGVLRRREHAILRVDA